MIIPPLGTQTSVQMLVSKGLKSFTLSNASLDLHLSRSLISQVCLDNSACEMSEKTLF